MSWLSDMAARGASQLFAAAGQTVTRYPAGDESSGTSVTAVFAEEEKGTRQETRGRDNVRRGTLQVLDSQTVDPKDRWLIGSEVWDTSSLGTQPGVKLLQLVRVEGEIDTGQSETHVI